MSHLCNYCESGKPEPVGECPCRYGFDRNEMDEFEMVQNCPLFVRDPDFFRCYAVEGAIADKLGNSVALTDMLATPKSIYHSEATQGNGHPFVTWRKGQAMLELLLLVFLLVLVVVGALYVTPLIHVVRP